MYVYVLVFMYVCMYACTFCIHTRIYLDLYEYTPTLWRGCIGCLFCVGHVPQKSPIIRGSFAERDLHLKASFASLPPCTNDFLRPPSFLNLISRIRGRIVFIHTQLFTHTQTITLKHKHIYTISRGKKNHRRIRRACPALWLAASSRELCALSRFATLLWLS